MRCHGTVLIVDDEPVVREAARSCLERQGYGVVTADSGAAAVEALRADPAGIRLVLLDLGMPAMDGGETLPLLRAIQPNLPVLLSSGYSEPEALKALGGARVSGFIQKPYTADKLARAVQSVLVGGGL
jgi:CheY-like chemotaxis protein